MTVTITGTAQSLAVAAGPPSKTRTLGLQLTVTDTGSTLPNRETLSLYIGKASTTPAIFSDLTGAVLVDDSGNFSSFSYQLTTAATVYSIKDAAVLSSFTAGDHLWLCLFGTLTASGSDAIQGSKDLGVLAA